MNLLVLTNLYPPHYVGGYELHCQLIVEALRSRGHSVRVLTSNHVIEGVPSQNEQHVSRTLNIHGLFGHPFRNILKLQQLEIHNNRILRAEIEKSRPELVFIWAFAGLSKSMLHTLQRLGIPTVFAVCDHWIARSNEADVWLHWWQRRDGSLAQKCLRSFWELTGTRKRLDKIAPTTPIQEFKFQRLYFCSKALRTFTQNAGYPVSHGAVIYCPIDITKFSGVVKKASQPIQKLLYAGRLHEDKGVFTALKALALIRNKFAGELNIYGAGHPDFVTKLRSFAEEWKLPVKFHPLFDPGDMPDVYRAHDALLFTSEWAEPFALTPLEAMASGLPVIGTTTGGSVELFRNKENSLTYTAGSAEDLAQRILELDSNPILRERIARTGHEEVRANYAAPYIIEQVENYLHETLVKKKPSLSEVPA
ncbi:MAG: glycosyltransferase family 4 protein [Verrucomicrobia bacterium]|nr:glycosyltransferase family 4 protein [Verrucomicrobiota bacterium]